ncbi:hypothetical protein AB0F91_38990 [Amycolatopsis sp. NPDC023774]|uniref:hypothetical protein n=1 Tax=Amycolatopsis sp. NPDC023774 TaxID=3155015 RepID=UPI0033E14E8C
MKNTEAITLFDNIAFPLREHTRKSETEIRRIVHEKPELTGLAGAGRLAQRDLRRHAQTRAAWTARSA